jgi:hypothetical protein
VAKKGAKPHQLLEITPEAGLEAAQDAFHKIARMAHPDLHRNSLTPEELELVTTAYARIAAAYQDLRTATMQTGRLPSLRSDPPPPRPLTGTPRAGSPPQTGPLPTRAAGSQPTHRLPTDSEGDAGKPGAAAGAMSSKALIYYRKAELCLRRGDLKGAVLQLKMAIACDPQSVFLRTALAEVEAEVGKK